MTDILKDIRHKLIECAYHSQASHLGSALSLIEILYSLYFNVANITNANLEDDARDRIILSKGHGSLALYIILAYKGIVPMSFLDGYLKDGGTLPCHIDKETVRGLEVSTGSLGHGLGLGEGIAIANRIKGVDSKVFVILGDGEMQEGSVWEALNSISSLKLNNLMLIIDNNGFQSSAATKDVTNAQNLKERLDSFGYFTIEVDGHNVDQLTKAFKVKSDKPVAVIANTVKGKGCSYMENLLSSHYLKVNRERFYQYLKEEGINEAGICG